MSLVELASFLGGIGDFVGSFAVIITLLYLARQVKHAKHEISLVGRQARANQRPSWIPS